MHSIDRAPWAKVSSGLPFWGTNTTCIVVLLPVRSGDNRSTSCAPWDLMHGIVLLVRIDGLLGLSLAFLFERW